MKFKIKSNKLQFNIIKNKEMTYLNSLIKKKSISRNI